MAAEAEAEVAAVTAVTNAGRAGDWKASAWWLERKYPQRWGRHRGELIELLTRVREREAMVERACREGAGG